MKRTTEPEMIRAIKLIDDGLFFLDDHADKNVGKATELIQEAADTFKKMFGEAIYYHILEN